MQLVIIFWYILKYRYEGRKYESCGCIKCGLDNSVLYESRDCLSGTQKIMYDYLKKIILVVILVEFKLKFYVT